MTTGARYQLYFYLYNLRSVEPNVRGVLVYPKERKKEEIILNDEIIIELENILKGIIEIANLNKPPSIEKRPFCKRCSFYELCMV